MQSDADDEGGTPLSAGGTQSDAIDDGGTPSDLLSTCGTQSDAIDDGGTPSDLLSACGTQSDAIDDGGTPSDFLSACGTQSDAIDDGGTPSDLLSACGTQGDALNEDCVPNDTPSAGNCGAADCFEDEGDPQVPFVTGIEDDATRAALTYLWAVMSGVSEAALDVNLRLQKIMGNGNNLPPNVQALHRIIDKRFSIDLGSIVAVEKFYVCQICPTECVACAHAHRSQVVVPSLSTQVKDIMSRMFAQFIEYEYHLLKNPGSDVLNSASAFDERLERSSDECSHVHLLVCADGAKFVKSTEKSFWPVQAQILNISPTDRQAFANIVLLAMIESAKKPDFEKILPILFSRLSRKFTHGQRPVIIHLSFFMADLPALAQIFKIHQFNGSFGCPKCLHPGETLKGERVFLHMNRKIFPARLACRGGKNLIQKAGDIVEHLASECDNTDSIIEAFNAQYSDELKTYFKTELSNMERRLTARIRARGTGPDNVTSRNYEDETFVSITGANVKLSSFASTNPTEFIRTYIRLRFGPDYFSRYIIDSRCGNRTDRQQSPASHVEELQRLLRKCFTVSIERLPDVWATIKNNLNQVARENKRRAKAATTEHGRHDS